MRNRFLFSLAAAILLMIVCVWLLIKERQRLVQPLFPVFASSSSATSSPSPTIIPVTVVPVPTPTRLISTGPYINHLAPPFSLKTLSADPVVLEDYRGKVVLLNFWASWCIPCKEEMPLLQVAYEEHREHGLVVLGINMTDLDERRAIERFIQETGVTFPIGLDEDGAVSEAYRIISIPTSFFLDRTGIIHNFQLGAMTKDQLEQYLDEMLK